MFSDSASITLKARRRDEVRITYHSVGRAKVTHLHQKVSDNAALGMSATASNKAEDRRRKLESDVLQEVIKTYRKQNLPGLVFCKY